MLNLDKTKCYGCGACKSVCPRDAIVMQEDEKGFLFPKIIKEKCINCGLCENLCFQKQEQSLKETMSYAVKNKDENIRIKSSSGGTFTAISEYVLKEDGVIYGAIYGEGFEVVHKRVTTEAELEELRGSKYVQSNLGESFKQIKDDLKDGKKVLFVGTPCQVYGLSKCLKQNERENLIMVDLICHGVPSPKLWKNYVEYLEKEYKSPLKYFTFRNKEEGWRGYHLLAKFQNGKESKSRKVYSFLNIFGSDIALRESCYHCPFSTTQRISDMTIGDFWGVEKALPEFDDNKGISLMLIHSEKGLRIFREIEKQLSYKKTSIQDCLQHNLREPTRKPEKSERFWQDFQKHDYAYLAKKYGVVGAKSVLKNKMQVLLKRLKK